jgi:hypothetical protein
VEITAAGAQITAAVGAAAVMVEVVVEDRQNQAKSSSQQLFRYSHEV